MLHSFIIEGNQNSGQRANASWGSLFHGVLHEQMPASLAENLHEDSLRPYSQYVLCASAADSLAWHVQTWQDDMAEAIQEAFRPEMTVNIRYKKANFLIKNVEHMQASEEAWALPFFTQEIPPSIYTLRFLTPCTHKSEGCYVLFPTPALIVNGLYRRFSQFSSTLVLDDTDAMRAVASNMEIISYRMHSQSFSLENVRIKGYMGALTVCLHGNNQLKKLGGMLLNFAAYAGVGIKTSLGMGACEVQCGYPVKKGNTSTHKEG